MTGGAFTKSLPFFYHHYQGRGAALPEATSDHRRGRFLSSTMILLLNRLFFTFLLRSRKLPGPPIKIISILA